MNQFQIYFLLISSISNYLSIVNFISSVEKVTAILFLFMQNCLYNIEVKKLKGTGENDPLNKKIAAAQTVVKISYYWNTIYSIESVDGHKYRKTNKEKNKWQKKDVVSLFIGPWIDELETSK